MAAVNSKNAALLLAMAGAGPYTRITKTHGLNLTMPTEWADASSHGQSFKSYTQGQMDFSATVTQWYDTVQYVLDHAAIDAIPYYFLAYFNYPSDTLNYWRGQCTVGLEGHNLDIGQTIDASYSLRLYNDDVALVRGGTAL